VNPVAKPVALVANPQAKPAALVETAASRRQLLSQGQPQQATGQPLAAEAIPAQPCLRLAAQQWSIGLW